LTKKTITIQGKPKLFACTNKKTREKNKGEKLKMITQTTMRSQTFPLAKKSQSSDSLDIYSPR